MMASTVADNVSTSPAPLADNPSRIPLRLRARAPMIASGYRYRPPPKLPATTRRCSAGIRCGPGSSPAPRERVPASSKSRRSRGTGPSRCSPATCATPRSTATMRGAGSCSPLPVGRKAWGRRGRLASAVPDILRRRSITQRATVAVHRRRGQGAPTAGGASASAQKRAQSTTSCQSKRSAAWAIAPTRASFAAAASTAP